MNGLTKSECDQVLASEAWKTWDAEKRALTQASQKYPLMPIQTFLDAIDEIAPNGGGQSAAILILFTIGHRQAVFDYVMRILLKKYTQEGLLSIVKSWQEEISSKQ